MVLQVQFFLASAGRFCYIGPCVITEPLCAGWQVRATHCYCRCGCALPWAGGKGIAAFIVRVSASSSQTAGSPACMWVLDRVRGSLECSRGAVAQRR